MKQTIRIVLLVVLLACVMQAQSNYWYNNLDGSPINMEVYDNVVAVRFDPEIPGLNAQQFAYEREYLSDTVTIDFGPGQFFVFGVEAGYSLNYVMTILRFNDTIAMVNPVVRNEYGERSVLDNSLIVTYKPTATAIQISSLENAYDLTVTETFQDSLTVTHFLSLNSRIGNDITWLARQMYNSGLCLVSEPNMTFAGRVNTNDPYYGEQWQLKNTGQQGGTPGVDIDWELSQQYSIANMTPPVVAVVDAGFQMTHEDFPPNCWRRPYDAAGENLIWNEPDDDPTNSCDGPEPLCWHGTAVLGILEAYTDNEVGLAGTESRASIMPVKVYDDYRGMTSLQVWIRALDWICKPPGPANIVCITSSATYSVEIERRLGEMYRSGKPIIAAAGNRGTVEYPASSRYVLAVGMSDKNDNIPSSSGQGSALDLVAPAVDVWSLDLMGSGGVNPGLSGNVCNTNRNYACHFTGTSFAAPMVAGIAAKLLLRNPWLLGPKVKDSAEVMYDYLRRSCERQHYGVANNDYRRVNNTVGWGRVNANRALIMACKSCGDANDDRTINISDAVYLIAYIFSGGRAPKDCIYPQGLGDANGSGTVNMSDAVYLIAYIMANGTAPRCQ